MMKETIKLIENKFHINKNDFYYYKDINLK